MEIFAQNSRQVDTIRPLIDGSQMGGLLKNEHFSSLPLKASSSKKCSQCYGSNYIILVIFNMIFKNTNKYGGFPGGAVVENLPANAGNTGSSPGLGGSHMPLSN